MIEQAVSEDLTIVFHFTDGERFSQTLPIDCADAAHDVMEWFKNPKEGPVWTWLHPHSKKLQMLPRSQIVFIEIFGYIALDGFESKWYHRLWDKLRTKWMMRKI